MRLINLANASISLTLRAPLAEVDFLRVHIVEIKFELSMIRRGAPVGIRGGKLLRQASVGAALQELAILRIVSPLRANPKHFRQVFVVSKPAHSCRAIHANSVTLVSMLLRVRSERLTYQVEIPSDNRLHHRGCKLVELIRLEYFLAIANKLFVAYNEIGLVLLTQLRFPILRHRIAIVQIVLPNQRTEMPFGPIYGEVYGAAIGLPIFVRQLQRALRILGSRVGDQEFGR